MSPFRSWEVWTDDVFQLMVDSYQTVFGANANQPAISRGEINWEEWRPWYEAGLSPREAIEQSLITD